MYSNYFHTLGNDMEQTAESDRGRPSLYGVNRFVCRFLAGDSVAELSWRILLVVAVVAVIGVAGVGSAAAATTATGTFTSQSETDESPQVSVSGVSVSPEQPVPDELVEIETTIRNAETGPQAVDVEAVYVREANGVTEYDRIRDLGTVTPGGVLNVPLTTTFEEPGIKNLRVNVVTQAEGGEIVTFEYPVTVVVRESGLEMGVSISESTVDGGVVSVTVLNGRESAARNLELDVDTGGASFDDPVRREATVESGAEETYTFTVTDGSLSGSVEATLAYTTPMGQRMTLTRTASADAGDGSGTLEHPLVDLSVEEAMPGATRSVNVTVANGLDTTIRQLDVSLSSPDVAFATTERVASSLGAGTDRGFEFDATVPGSGTYPVTVELRYTEDNVTRRVTRTFQAAFESPDNPGEVRLTGTEAVIRGGVLELSATASNVGSTEATGVVVAVDGDDAPAVERADYFVGDVEGGDFSSFTIEAQVTENVSTVPVEVRYAVDGAEQSYVTEVPVRQAPAADEPGGDGGGFPLLVPVAGLVALLIGGVIYRRLR